MVMTATERVNKAIEEASIGHGRFSSWTGNTGRFGMVEITLEDLLENQRSIACIKSSAERSDLISSHIWILSSI